MTRSLATLALALVLPACATVEPPRPAGTTIDFRRDPEPTLALSTLDGAEVGVPLRDDQREVVERIAADPAAFLAGAPPTEVLNEAELVFFGAGRLFELAVWYADAVEGGATDLRPRLAWAYERVGLHSEAIRVAEQAVEEAPGDPEAWFVLGYVHGQAEAADDAMLERVAEAFSRAVELDPEFVGPGGVTASELRRQATDIRTALVRRRTPPTADPHRGAMPRDPHAGVPGAPPLNVGTPVRAGAQVPVPAAPAAEGNADAAAPEAPAQ